MSALLFIAVTVLCACLFYYGAGKNKKILWTGLAWLLAVGLASGAGFFKDAPPRFLLVIGGTVLFTVYWYRQADISQVSLPLLLAVHSVRLPVELALYQLYRQKKIPQVMTFEGWNYDIVMGISAILLLLYVFPAKRRIGRRTFIAWNIAGIILLSIIVCIAILSAPLPVQQFGFEQPNVGLLEFPFALLPAGIVPAVLLSHILAVRKARQ